MKKTISKTEDKGGERTAMRTKRARHQRLVAKTSTAGDVKRDSNRSSRGGTFCFLARFAVSLAPWTNSVLVLVDEIEMTMEPTGVYRYISIKLHKTLAPAKAWRLKWGTLAPPCKL